MAQSRNYYAFRHGAQLPNQGLNALQRIVASEFSRLEAEGLFQWHLGTSCVDAGYLPGKSAGNDPGTYVEWELGKDLWPFGESLSELDEDWIFTIIEFLHAHAALPTRSRYHDYSDCGLHVHSADEATGRTYFQDSMNRYLLRYNDGYELRGNGEVWHSAPTGLEDLTPAHTGHTSIDNPVSHAVATFRRWNSTENDKRDAIRNLAGVLEQLRGDENTGLQKKEEDRLFEIANNYGIRHFNSKQRTGYDVDVWLDWIFYSYLNAIDLASNLIDRESLPFE